MGCTAPQINYPTRRETGRHDANPVEVFSGETNSPSAWRAHRHHQHRRGGSVMTPSEVLCIVGHWVEHTELFL
jgi:hypothetical protein